jgi:CRP/FNR family transcriptional regulator
MSTFCTKCGWQSWAQAAGLTHSECASLDAILVHSRRVHKGAHLHRCGARLESIAMVHSGFFKNTVSQEDGIEQVVSFSLAQDWVGLEAIASGRHRCTSVALEDSSVCCAPYASLMELCDRIPKLQHHFHRVMAAEMKSAAGLMLLLGNVSAQARVAKFLLRMSARLAERGYSARKLRLPMSRRDLGSYLGLRLETISRTFGALCEEELIAVEGREVLFKSVEGLVRKAERFAVA